MHIQHISSHLNGKEFLLVHRHVLYEQIIDTVATTPQADLLYKLKRQGWALPNDCQLYFVKDRVAVEIQFDQHSLLTHELFANHLALYVGDQVDVGIEIFFMKSLQNNLDLSEDCHESDLYNVVRQGRGVPAVPLVLVEIDA